LPGMSPTMWGLDHDRWLGRFWLPACDRVDPKRSFCLVRRDGQIGEMILERFANSASGLARESWLESRAV
jgi:hypothetical protein